MRAALMACRLVRRLKGRGWMGFMGGLSVGTGVRRAGCRVPGLEPMAGHKFPQSALGFRFACVKAV